MTLSSAFNVGVNAMNADTMAFSAISDNIANMNTTSYKQTQVAFKDMLANDVSTIQAFGGVRPVAQQFVSRQGVMESTGGNLDVAIDGRGFFVTNTAADGSGQTAYTRDGNFGLKVEPSTAGQAATGVSDKTYVVDKNGNYVMGWAGVNGVINPSGNPVALEVDPQTVGTTMAVATTTAMIAANASATAVAGDTHIFGIGIYDDQGGSHSLNLTFTKGALPNTWSLTTSGDANLNPVTVPVTFNGNAQITAPLNVVANITWPANAQGVVPAPSNINVDISQMTQFSDSYFQLGTSSQDGFPLGNLQGMSFGAGGILQGSFSNGTKKDLYQLPLALFENPDGMERLSGNQFLQSVASGTPTLGNNGQATGAGAISGGRLEASNVDVNDEFTRMIRMQKAYSTASTAIKTADEMMQLLRNL